MPSIIDYPTVLERLESEGLKCHYPNGGSFGFPKGGQVRGWLGPADETIQAGNEGERSERERAV